VEGQPATSTAVAATVKLDGLRKFAVRSQNKRTVYSVYEFFGDVSEKLHHFSNINVCIKLL
jgi:hypothetical protein